MDLPGSPVASAVRPPTALTYRRQSIVTPFFAKRSDDHIGFSAMACASV